MRFRQVLAHKVALTLLYLILLADDFDAATTASTCRLQNVHVLVVVHLTIIEEPLVVLREDVRDWADLELLAVLASLLLNMAPQVCLAADAPGARKVIQLLVLTHSLQLARSYQRRPEAVPTGRAATLVDQMETSRLHGIHDAIVCMRVLVDPERQVREGKEVLL